MNEQFHYKYTAPTEEERKEIDSIRRQYCPQKKTETPLERLRRLDGRVKNSAIIPSLCLGVVGCLIFGLGLTMILEWNILLWGVLCSILGCLPMIFAYPAYRAMLKKGKAKYSEEILRLSEELLHENK